MEEFSRRFGCSLGMVVTEDRLDVDGSVVIGSALVVSFDVLRVEEGKARPLDELVRELTLEGKV